MKRFSSLPLQMERNAFGFLRGKKPMNNTVIVPMRSGSKGIKNKNIREFVNLPLYYWSLKKLYNLSCIGKVNKIIVSSDNDWYLDRVKTSFSFMKEETLILSKRPDELATDITTTEEVCIYELTKHNINAGIMSIIELTSPLIPVESLSLMFSAIDDITNSSFLVYPDVGQYWRCIKNNDYKWEKLYSDRKMRQRENEILYKEVGAWSVRVDAFKEYKNRIVEPCMPIVIDKEYGISINTEEDFVYAEYLMKENSPQLFKDNSIFKKKKHTLNVGGMGYLGVFFLLLYLKIQIIL